MMLGTRGRLRCEAIAAASIAVLPYTVFLIELSSGACADVPVLSVVSGHEEGQECRLCITNICVSCAFSAFPTLFVCSFSQQVSRLGISQAMQAGTVEGFMCLSSLLGDKMPWVTKCHISRIIGGRTSHEAVQE